MTLFREKIRAQIADHGLQAALDANAERRTKRQTAASTSLPDWQARRQRAHNVRAEVIDRLDDYVAQFTQRAQASGVNVHRAGDAAEAVRLVLGILERGGAGPPPGTMREPSLPGRLVAKSKSMVSEEIGLNPALEAAGHRVVETDLGEYIVQLRGERPSHIIAPAVHLRRHEVGQLFHEKLGIPYTEDIPTLTNTARRVLREVFLTADVGISGVNFGVAETGAVCLVTNEGNGRMVTTLPPVHIALMGMERLVPTLDDLGLMLSLLSRSATGQKLSVYTQLIHRPLDGQQRHIIILDNGRSGLRDSPLRESLYCIRCGACLNACPVFREIGGHGYLGRSGQPVTYPGPIGSVISAGLRGGDEFGNLAQASSLCGACKEACPVDIDLPKLLLRVRAGQSPVISVKAPASPERLPSAEGVGLSSALRVGVRLFTWTARRPRLFAFSQWLLGWFSAPLPRFLQLPATKGWGLSKDFPRPEARPFRARWKGSIDAEEITHGQGREIESGLEQQPAGGGLDFLILGSTAARVLRFAQELKAVRGHAARCSGQELHRHIIDFLQSRGVSRIYLGLGLLDEPTLMAAGIACTSLPDPTVRAGVTGAICGLADTGSVVVSEAAGGPLWASLLPEIHIVILRASEVLATLADALALPGVRNSRTVVVITGPSRTGDIEMSHTLGVHGPGEVHVFIVDG